MSELTDTQRELITWLIAVVPAQYWAPSVLLAVYDLKSGSLDGMQEILEDYVTGNNKLGYQFKTMTREEILDHAETIKRASEEQR